MITYDRLWITLKKKNISQYRLIKDYGIAVKNFCNAAFYLTFGDSGLPD